MARPNYYSISMWSKLAHASIGLIVVRKSAAFNAPVILLSRGQGGGTPKLIPYNSYIAWSACRENS